jgi:multidrug resistance efflux pump
MHSRLTDRLASLDRKLPQAWQPTNPRWLDYMTYAELGVLFRAADRVKSGKPVTAAEETDLQASAAEAQARMLRGEPTRIERWQAVVANHQAADERRRAAFRHRYKLNVRPAVSKTELEHADAEVLAAQAALDKAKVELNLLIPQIRSLALAGYPA